MARSALSRDRIGTVHAQDRPDARPIGFGAPGVGATGVERSTAETDPAVDDQAPIAVTGVAGGGVMVTFGAAGLVAPSHPGHGNHGQCEDEGSERGLYRTESVHQGGLSRSQRLAARP